MEQTNFYIPCLCQWVIDLDKSGYQENIFLISRGASNEYPQHMFLLRNKKKYRYFLVEKSALSRAMWFFEKQASKMQIQIHPACAQSLIQAFALL